MEKIELKDFSEETEGAAFAILHDGPEELEEEQGENGYWLELNAGITSDFNLAAPYSAEFILDLKKAHAEDLDHMYLIKLS